MNEINFANILLWRGKGGRWVERRERKRVGELNETFIFTTVVTRAQDKCET